MKTSSKIRIAILVTIIVFFVCYKLAISKTLHLRQEYVALSKDKNQSNTIEEQIGSLLKKEVYLDSMLTSLNLGSNSTQNSLLDFISRQEVKNKIRVVDFNPAHTVTLDEGVLVTHDIKLQGDFLGILETLYELETNSGLGSLSHVYFIKSRNPRTKKSYLQATLFVEEYR